MGLIQLLRRPLKRPTTRQRDQRSHPSSPKLPSDLVLHIFQLAIDHLCLHHRLRTLSTFAFVFAASRSWAQQALVEQAQVASPRRVKQLHATLLARPDLAWSVKSLEVQTRGGRADVEAISRLLRACPVLEDLRLDGPAQISSALLTVASLNTPSLRRLSLSDITLQDSPPISTALTRLSRLSPAPSMPLELPSIRQLSRTFLTLGHPQLDDAGEAVATQHPKKVFPSLVDLSFDLGDLQLAYDADSYPDFLLQLAPQLRSLSIHHDKDSSLDFISSCTSLQLLSIPLHSLDALLGAHLPPRPLILRLTDDPSAPCSNEVYSDTIQHFTRALGHSQTAISALQLLVVPDAKERDFWGERALAEMRYEAGARGVTVSEEGALNERASEEQFWELCEELERLKRRKRAEEASPGLAL